MSSATSQEYKEITDEINANFSVVDSTICALKSELSKGEFNTSYVFISQNVKHVVSYIQRALENILSKAKNFGNIWVSSPLQMFAYRGNPIVIYEYRDTIREFSESVRAIVSNLYTNVGKTLAAYILVYETLEKFGFKPPFVLVESSEFSSQNLIDFVFDEFETIGPRVEYEPSKSQVITYSGIDVSETLSLLIVGHESFHIIDRLGGVFDGFCRATGFNGGKRCREALVDVMSTLYFGPVYAYAMQRHFEKRYPLSGESHMEMNIRLLALDYLISVLGIGKGNEAQAQRLTSFIKLLEKRMDKDALENARNDRKQLDMMLDKGIIGYVKNYFKGNGISTYEEFVKVVEKREFDSDHEKIDRERIRFMLRKEIPAAVRPTTLLNALYGSGDIDMIDSRLITASFKKWYVKRYYEKSLEKK